MKHMYTSTIAQFVDLEAGVDDSRHEEEDNENEEYGECMHNSTNPMTHDLQMISLQTNQSMMLVTTYPGRAGRTNLTAGAACWWTWKTATCVMHLIFLEASP
jgi:hypothetical protein